MKVLHITRSSKGGAGIAALRLHQALSQPGVESAFISTNLSINYNNEVLVDDFFTYKRPSFLQRILNKGISFFSFSFKDKLIKEFSVLEPKLDCEIATLPFSNYKLHEHPLVKAADIINLHWIDGIVDYPSFFLNCKKPMVWTFHDRNPFQGIFHYQSDEIRNLEAAKIFNIKIKDLKEIIYKKSSIHTIVSPSKWLLQESEKSDLMKVYPHKHIFNGADECFFKPLNTHNAREVLKLPKDKIIFLFASQDVSCYRKGFDVIENVINELDFKDLFFVAIGKPPINQNKKIHYLGTISCPETMVLAYAASNAFLLPSREDNLPNTMVESLLCGTPVISSNLGGMKEVIVNDENGYLIDGINIESFKSCILKFVAVKNLFNSNTISLDARYKFSRMALTSNYLSLYKSIYKDQNSSI